MNEFSLIQQYFQRPQTDTAVTLGIGDDCALVRVAEDHELVVTVDTSIVGRHFPADADPYSIGWRALAVNLSDLASMGAKPRWISLALTLPEASPDWLHGFSQGLFELANRYDVSLIGGDTTQGPLSISIQAMGEVPVGQAHRRDGSQPDDLVYVSGSLGDSKAGLDCYFANADQCSIDRSHRELLIARYLRPEPRVELGLALRGIATGCLDVSDGLIQDLQHICRASQLGAELSATALPLSAALRQYDLQYRQAEAESNPAGTVSNPGHTASYALAAALGGGDDYELCFTVPEHKVAELEAIAEKLALPLTAVGRVTKASEAGKVKVLDAAGREIALANTGYKHF